MAITARRVKKAPSKRQFRVLSARFGRRILETHGIIAL
jgi:hypothetical protein